MSESESDVEYSDALDSPLESGMENLNLEKDEFGSPQQSRKTSESCSEKDEEETVPVDPFAERKENEARLSDEEKETRRQQAKELKQEGNSFYTLSQTEEAISQYTKALEICPLCFEEDRAILYANRAAVHVLTDDKESAVSDCTKALELKPDYVKALLRRGQAYENLDKPHEALQDFESALKIDPGIKEANIALMRLPDKIKEKDEKLKAEMLDNLKKLGNMVLKPFGLSTNNFNLVQDPATGGYSVNFSK